MPRRLLAAARSVHAVLLTCFVGCGGSREAAVYPVTGTLTFNGLRVANAMVAFHPLGPTGSEAALPVAATNADGAFRLTTYATGDGAPAGKYAVTVVWPDHSQPRDECEDILMHDHFEGRYADPAKTPWHVTVHPGNNEVPLQAASVDASHIPQ